VLFFYVVYLDTFTNFPQITLEQVICKLRCNQISVEWSGLRTDMDVYCEEWTISYQP